MKIEIGESLIYSYLRHEKGCLVTQTNWKASGNWNISEDIYDSVKYEFNRLKKHHSFADIFGNQKLEQVIKQAEIDVLGVSLISGEQRVYAFEVAFHEAGLNYGSKMETRNRVLKKLLRGYLTLKCYFPNHKYTLAFCSPKVNNATEQYIQEYFDVLSEFQSDDVLFEYFSNEKFYTDIMQKTLDITTSESDSSELFSRAVKLLKLSESFKHSLNEPNEFITPLHTEPEIPTEDSTNTSNNLHNRTVIINGAAIPTSPINNETVQNYVKNIMGLLIHQNLLSNEEIRRLQNKEYCQEIIGIQHPLLLRRTESPYDNAGHSRYWTSETFGDFYVCSQWWREHHPLYLRKIYIWLHKLADKQ